MSGFVVYSTYSKGRSTLAPRSLLWTLDLWFQQFSTMISHKTNFWLRQIYRTLWLIWVLTKNFRSAVLAMISDAIKVTTRSSTWWLGGSKTHWPLSLKFKVGELSNLEQIQRARGDAAHTWHSSSQGWGTGVPLGLRKPAQLKNQSQTGQPKRRDKNILDLWIQTFKRKKNSPVHQEIV